MRQRALSIVLALVVLDGQAQPAPDPATQASRRFPQPVRVGDLIGRDVLEPKESQPVLGRVEAVGRRADGGLVFVIRYGGVLGVGARPIAVPADAVALLGEHVAVIDLTPSELRTLPTVGASEVTPVGPDDVIRVGVVRPFH